MSNIELTQTDDSERTTRSAGSVSSGAGTRDATVGNAVSDRLVSRGSNPGDASDSANKLAGLTVERAEEESEITVISKKPPQQFCTSGFDWRKVGELLIGRQLGSYRLDSLLGVGGMGAVFQATDLQLHRQVAVKVLNSAENDPEAERRFRVEAQSAARLDHQNIARVFHVGQDQGWNYIVLELVEGQTLRQLIAARGPLSLKLAIHFFRQLASALDHAHQRNIIHRDIKPSNVLVTGDQLVKIVDMGLARIQPSTESVEHDAEAGMTLGTFDYLAPEQARDARQADQQSDLYSLGCTMFYALVGRPPFADGTTIEKILSHSNAPRPSVLESRPDLPLSVERLVQSLMAPRREDRIGTAKELEQRLLDLRWEMNRAVRPKDSHRVAPQVSTSRVPLMLIGVTLVLMVISLVWDSGWRASEVTLPEWPNSVSLTEATAVTNEDIAPILSVPENSTEAVDRPEDARNRTADGATDALNLRDRSSTVELPMETANPAGAAANAMKDLSEPANLSAEVKTFTGLLWDQNFGSASIRSGQGLQDPRGPMTRPSNSGKSEPLFPFLGGNNDRFMTRRDWWLVPSLPDDNSPAPMDGQTSNLRMVPERSEIGSLPQDHATTARELITTISVVPTDLSVSDSPSEARELGAIPANVARVASLSQALASLKQFPNVRRIELDFDGVHQVAALSVPRGGLREIRAAAGKRPVLRFAASEDLPNSSKTARITVECGVLEISDIAFIWETVPSNPETFFEISEFSRVNFVGCSLEHLWSRLVVAAGVGESVGSRTGSSDELVVSRFELPTWIRIVPTTATTIETQKHDGVTVTQCSIYGSANGVVSHTNHGILRSVDSLLVTAGSAVSFRDQTPPSSGGRIEIELVRSSVLARLGVVQVWRQDLPAIAVSIFAQDCFLVAGDPACGLLQERGREAETGLRRRSEQDINNGPEPYTVAESLFSFEGFNNATFANYLWSSSGYDGEVYSRADANQILAAKWFQQDLTRYATLAPFTGNEIEKLISEPAFQLTSLRLYQVVDQKPSEHGVDFSKIPKFPMVPDVELIRR
jgi:serine/threonine protein kinase